MRQGESYTTGQVQKFLDINHTATLGRLKKLQKLQYVKLKMQKRIYHWEKIRDIPEKEITSGYKFII